MSSRGGGWTVRKACRRARVNCRFGAGREIGGGVEWPGGVSHPRFSASIFVDTKTSEIAFDESKRQVALAKHGYDFADFERRFDRDAALILPPRPSRTGRARYLLIGRWNGGIVVLAVMSTLGSEALSLVSLRRADEQEREAYDRHVAS